MRAWLGNAMFAVGVLGMTALFALCSSVKVYALGVGAAQADSYIGERLSLRIPLFNVSNPNNLSVDFSSPQFGREGQSVVEAELDRSNSQLAIKLTSNSVINEPYLDFSLELIDNGSAFNKDFTVLLDLAPLTPGAASTTRPSRVNSASDSYSVSDLSAASDSSVNRASPDSDLMGPYDYAEAGRIPSRFGAVLDGQSLWRVARRINGAMGVSRSQMMWALYQANRGAFASQSVQSLKAGSFLTIPKESVVKQVSHEQAKANLSALSSGDSARIVAAPTSANTDALAEFANNDTGSSKQTSGLDESAANNPFQVTGVGDLNGRVGDADSQRAQEIIVSLTESIGNLSQQLAQKDGKIESLEAQVAELKSFISDETALNSASSLKTANDSVTNVPSAADQNTVTEPDDTNTSGINNSGITEASTIGESVLEAEVDTPLATTTPATTASKIQTIIESTPLWAWALVAFSVLVVLCILLRKRISQLWQSLNIFGSNERVEFNDQSALEMPKLYSRDAAAFDSTPSTPYQPTKTSAQNGTTKDYSELVAVEKTGAENALAGITYKEIDDDGSFEPNDVLEFLTEEAEKVEDGDLSFDERFNYLLEEKDFDFARELLDFARYNEINDERYHFERLRLLEKMQDEDGFYQYYYEIEEQIPSFPQAVQTEISQLVVQLAHH